MAFYKVVGLAIFRGREKKGIEPILTDKVGRLLNLVCVGSIWFGGITTYCE